MQDLKFLFKDTKENYSSRVYLDGPHSAVILITYRDLSSSDFGNRKEKTKSFHVSISDHDCTRKCLNIINIEIDNWNK